MKTYYVRFGSGDPRTYSGLAPTFLTFNTYGTGVTPPGITSVIGATGYYAFQYGVTTPIAFLIDGATTGLATADRYVSGSIDPMDRSDEYGTTLVAIGTSNIALGTTAVAIGTSLTAFGVTSLAYSFSLLSLGNTSVAIGSSLTALGVTSIAYSSSLSAIGNSNIAIGTSLTAFGVTSLAYSSSLIALGMTGVAIGTTILGSIGGDITNTAEILLRLGSTLSTFGTSAADPGDLFGYLKRMQEFNEGNQSFAKTTGAWTINSRGGSLLATKSLANSSTTVTKS